MFVCYSPKIFAGLGSQPGDSTEILLELTAIGFRLQLDTASAGIVVVELGTGCPAALGDCPSEKISWSLWVVFFCYQLVCARCHWWSDGG